MPNYLSWTTLPLTDALEHFKELQKDTDDAKKLYNYNVQLSNFISPNFNGKHIKDLRKNKYILIAKQSGDRYRLDVKKASKGSYTNLSSKQIRELQNFNDYLLNDSVKKDLKKRNKSFFILLAILLILVGIFVIFAINFGLFNLQF